MHITGLAAALMSVPVLVTLAAVWHGDLTAMAATVIYGASFITMILCSALYHMVPGHNRKLILRRFDHSAIYLKIAGTYTPFILLSGGQGAGLLAGMWGAALAGMGLKVVSPERFRWIGLALYVAMGWAGVFAGRQIFMNLSGPVLWLVVAGGLTYTAGIGFYVTKGRRFHNTIWHGFVLVASLVFMVAVGLHLADTAPTAV